MADVGSVSVGVVVHGDGLGEKLAATIRAAVLPVIKELNKELETTKRRSGEIDGKGFDKLTIAAREATAAVHALGEAHQRATRLSDISTEKQIRNYNLVADAADRSAQRQIEAALAVAAAREAIPDIPRGGGGGGGSDGGGRGGGRGDGGRRQGGFLGAVLSPVGLNAFATLSTAIDPAILGVAELTRSLVDLGGAGAAIPAVFAGIASSLGTVVFGFQGVGTALKDAMKAASTGNAKDLEKAAKSLEQLSPNAQSAAKALLEFAPAFKDLRNQVQDNIFAGLDTSLKSFITTSLPTLKTGLGDISKAWNSTFQELLRVGGSDQTQGFLGKIFGNTAQAQRQLNNAIQPLVSGMGRLAAQGSNFLPRLADGITKVATRFDNFIAKSVSSGALDQWIDRGFKGFAQLGNSVLNVGKIITNVTKALGGGQSFLGWLEDATTRLNNFVASAEGQKKLSDFFNSAREQWQDIKPVLTDIIKLAGDVLHGFEMWGQITTPILRPILEALSSFPGLISAAVTAFLGFRTLKGIGDLLGIGKAARDLDALPAAAERSAKGIRGAFSNLLPAAGVALGAGALGSSLLAPADGSQPSTLESLGGVGANVGGGAAAGYMVGGPIGAAIGGITGALVSLLEAVKRDIDTARTQFENYRDFKDTPAQQAADAASLRAQGRDVIEQPDLLTPGGPGYIRQMIANGQLPGYSVGPDNKLVGPDGKPLPLDLPPGATPYIPSSRYPTGQGPLPNQPQAPAPYGPNNIARIVNPLLPPMPTAVAPPPPPPGPGGSAYAGANATAAPAPTVTVPPGLGGLLGDSNLSGTKASLDEITNKIRELPKGKIEIESKIPEVKDELGKIATDITSLPQGEIKITDPSPQLLEALKGVDSQITVLNDHEIKVKGNTSEVENKLQALVRQYQGLEIQINLRAVLQPGPNLPGAPVQGPTVGGGRATGGMVPGYSPGVDNTLVPLSGGEGIIIPEAMRALGPAWLYNLNSRYRSGIPTRNYGFASGGWYLPTGVVPWPGKPDPKDPKRWPWPVGPLSPNQGGPVPGILKGPDWSGSNFGPPPPWWWTMPMNPDDYLFPDFWGPDKKGIWKYPGGRIKPWGMGFDSGGVFDLEEWLRKNPGKYPSASQLAYMAQKAPSWQQLQGLAAAGPKPATSYIGKAGSAPLAPNPSKTTSLGYPTSQYVNAAPGFQASQNLTNLRAGVQAAAQANVEGTIEAIRNPVETLKGMAPLVGLGGSGAPGVGEAWKNLGKGIVNWDQWSSDPWGAAGGTAVNIGALVYGGRKLPGQLSRGASRAATRLAPYAGASDWLSTVGIPALSSMPSPSMSGLAMMAAAVPPKALRSARRAEGMVDDPFLLAQLDLIPNTLKEIQALGKSAMAAAPAPERKFPGFKFDPELDDPQRKGYKPKRNRAYGTTPSQLLEGPFWEDGLREILEMGAAKMPDITQDAFLDRQAQFGSLWSAPDTFAIFKNQLRQGAQDAFRGKVTWSEALKNEMGHSLDPFGGGGIGDMRQFQYLLEALYGDRKYLSPEELSKGAYVVGANLAAVMQKAGDYNATPLWRGMTLTPEQSAGLKVGKVMPWSFSSTGTNVDIAKAYSGMRDPGYRYLYSQDTNAVEFQDMLARINEGHVPTVFEIMPGAVSLPVASQEVMTSGQMMVHEILEVDDPRNKHGVRWVTIEQLMPGFAEGGVLPGYSPGVDNMLVPLSGGEGIIIPEAMRALGSSWLYQLNRKYRSGISPSGYADGGVVGGPLGPDDTTVVGLLTQIRDLLAGGGGQSNPLNQTASNTSQMSTQLDSSGQVGMPGTKDFGFGFWGDGTPRNPGYEMAAAAIGALGGDAAKFLGPNPALPKPAQSYGGRGYGGGFGTGGAGAFVGPANLNVDALRQFALTGDTGSLAGTGLDPADPIVAAIATARNKKKGGLGAQAIADLVDQVIGGPGFDGVMDASNSTLISAMERYKQKMLKQPGARQQQVSPTASPTSLGALPAEVGYQPSSTIGADGYSMGRATAAVMLAQASSGGRYSWGGSDLVNGLSDCTGAVSDLVEVITTGRTSPGRLFSTANAASVLPQLGAVPGLVPGMLQIGFNSGHMAATLPNGVNFESGGGTGQGATYGGKAAGANSPQFNQRWSLPVDGSAMIPADLAATMANGGAGMGGMNPLGYNGAPVPVYIVNGPGGGTGAEGMLGMLNGPLGAFGGLAGGPGMDAINAVLGTGNRPLPDKIATLQQLIKEGNPQALASIFGIKIGDYSRAGGANDPLMVNASQYLADGTLLSDTGALSNRTVTDKDATKKAREQQMLDLTAQVRDNVSKDVLTPIMQNGVAGGIGQLDVGQLATIGQSMGQAAAQPIATAVSNAIKQSMPSQSAPPQNNNYANGIIGSIAGVAGAVGGMGFAEGGPIIGPGTGTSDSIIARLSNGEYVLPAADVRKAGGFGAIDAWRRSLPGFATGGGVNVNSTVGADFFGVSQVPILGTVINILISVLLALFGIQITARDTLDEMSKDVRQFRGDFQKFDAAGRLTNDTSALVDRTGSSAQAAADERIRILKIVIEQIIQYMIDNVAIPIGKAVANAAIQAGAGAASAAINSQAPGAGGIVGALITGAGSAGVDVAAQFISAAWASITPVVADTIGQALQTFLPGITTSVFGGGLLAKIFDPITAGFSGLSGAVATLVGAIFGGAAFDEGGLASGIGMLPKATIQPERVLSPQQTASFEQLVNLLASGAKPGSTTTIHAPFTVVGGEQAGRQVRDRLLALMS